MAVVGLVTSGSSIVGIIEPFVMAPAIDAFDYRSVFVVSAVLARPRRCVRLSHPGVAGPRQRSHRPARRTNSRWWARRGPRLRQPRQGLQVVIEEHACAAGRGCPRPCPPGHCLALRCEEPIIDIRALRRPILLTLAALVLAAGAFRSMLKLIGLVGQVPPDRGLALRPGRRGDDRGPVRRPNHRHRRRGASARVELAGRRGRKCRCSAGLPSGRWRHSPCSWGSMCFRWRSPARRAARGGRRCNRHVRLQPGDQSRSARTAGHGRRSGVGRPRPRLRCWSISPGPRSSERTAGPDIPAGGSAVSTAAGVHLYVVMAGLLFVMAAGPGDRAGKEAPSMCGSGDWRETNLRASSAALGAHWSCLSGRSSPTDPARPKE